MNRFFGEVGLGWFSGALMSCVGWYIDTAVGLGLGLFQVLYYTPVRLWGQVCGCGRSRREKV